MTETKEYYRNIISRYLSKDLQYVESYDEIKREVSSLRRFFKKTDNIDILEFKEVKRLAKKACKEVRSYQFYYEKEAYMSVNKVVNVFFKESGLDSSTHVLIEATSVEQAKTILAPKDLECGVYGRKHYSKFYYHQVGANLVLAHRYESYDI